MTRDPGMRRSPLSPDEIAARNAAAGPADAPAARQCRSCGDTLPPQHLRVQVAPPKGRWVELRMHDLHCLMDFLEDEEDAMDAGHDGELFTASGQAVAVPAQETPRT